MKLKLMLSLLTVSLLPVQLCATIVHTQIWQRPNGTRVVLLGDDAEESNAQKQQAIDCINYLKTLKTPYVLTASVYGLPLDFPGYLDAEPAISDMTRKNLIQHDAINIFTDEDLVSSDNNLTPLAKKFYAEALRMQPIISAPFAKQYLFALKSLNTLIEQLNAVEHLPFGPTDCCQECDPQLCDLSALDNIATMAEALFARILTSHIDLHTAHESCVWIHASMIKSLSMPLQTLGYTLISSTGTEDSKGEHDALSLPAFFDYEIS